MNRIDISQIVDPNKEQPFTAKSLEFLQNNTQEQNEIIMAALIGSSYASNIPYILSGCTGSVTTYTAGYVMFGGEIYPINAASAAANNPVQYELVTTPDPVADPIVFTDLTPGNVHNIKKYTELLSAGTGDFTSAQFVYLDKTKTQTALSPYATTTSGQEVVTGATFTAKYGKKYKITYQSDAYFAVSTGGCGFTVKIRNTTAGVTLATNQSGIGITAGIVDFPINISTLLTSFTPGDVINVTIQRSNANDVLLQYINFIVEEY
jgi:hypothetical protein